MAAYIVAVASLTQIKMEFSKLLLKLLTPSALSTAHSLVTAKICKIIQRLINFGNK